MKNAKGFYTKSLNMRECEAKGKMPYLNIAQSKLKCADIHWKGRGVEWHHNGNYIAFFVNNKGDIAKIKAIKAELKEAEKAQKGYCYKSKAEAMRIIANLPQCKCEEPLAIRVKSGKYGDFVCTDYRFYSDNDAFVKAENIEQKNAIERLF